MSFTDYAENKILEHMVGKTSWGMPTAYLAVSTTTPNDDGTNFTEPSGGAYARVQTAGTDWGTPATGAIANATLLAFPQATANWGTVTYGGVYDAATNGNLLYSGQLTVSQAVNTGNTLRFPIGQIVLSFLTGASLSYFGRHAILQHITGKSAWTMPTLNLGLSTTTPALDGTNFTPPSGGSYARVTTAGADWNNAASGALDNANILSFPTATANWGTVTYSGFWDASTNGNLYAFRVLGTAVAVNNGNTFRIPVGNADISLD